MSGGKWPQISSGARSVGCRRRRRSEETKKTGGNGFTNGGTKLTKTNEGRLAGAVSKYQGTAAVLRRPVLSRQLAPREARWG